MSNQSPAKSQETSSLLADDETERLSWDGVIKEDEDDENPATFVASDSRLIFSFGSGHFKDIGLNHIESIEVSAEDKSESKGANPDGIRGVGIGSIIVGGVVMFIGGFSALASLSGLVLIALGGYGVWYASKKYDELKEDFEIIEYTIYHVVLRTTAESQTVKPISFKTRDNIGPELSKLVQKSQ